MFMTDRLEPYKAASIREVISCFSCCCTGFFFPTLSVTLQLLRSLMVPTCYFTAAFLPCAASAAVGKVFSCPPAQCGWPSHTLNPFQLTADSLRAHDLYLFIKVLPFPSAANETQITSRCICHSFVRPFQGLRLKKASFFRCRRRDVMWTSSASLVLMGSWQH